MTEAREQVLEFFEKATERPARWASERTTLGDFDARERTLEIFDVLRPEELPLLRSLRPARDWAANLLGGTVVIVFHTPRETERLYKWVRAPRENGWSDGAGPKAIRAANRLRPTQNPAAARFAADRFGCPECC